MTISLFLFALRTFQISRISWKFCQTHDQETYSYHADLYTKSNKHVLPPQINYLKLDGSQFFFVWIELYSQVNINCLTNEHMVRHPHSFSQH